ncbi:N-acetylmuramoyl-L-alanine amidase [Oceanobacillus sp. Castelsardo]|uniref:peptidoglycan recognition protein family protein n=1 Tax=Oceanobacillus sp. Castelsardo TaxID=1851204 RepID=UPI0009EEDDA8|nr:N-acetylmuramoyl-L-alanine amidase [Oceanobacillus sp. Castelsardo]
MAINPRQKMVSSSKYNVKCPYQMTAKYITFHNTANDASANNEISYMINNNNQVSYHFAVDDKEVVQGLPLNRNGWHCGDGGSGTGNRQSIGVEVCYSKSGGEKYRKAEKLAIKFIAQLLHERGWGVERVKKHQDWSGKYCPHRVLDEGRWNDVKKAIESELNSLEGNKSKPIQKPASKPKHKPQATSKQKANLRVDGKLGSATIRALQIALGTPVDGKLSNQLKNAVTLALYGGVTWGRGGSLVIKALQKKIGAKADGYLGPDTVRALQSYLGTVVDGKLSRPSLVIKELQRRLNNGTF